MALSTRVVVAALALAAADDVHAQPACASLNPCADARLFCQLAADDPNVGVCVGQPCGARTPCPGSLTCDASKGYCLRCPANKLFYESPPCQATCADPNPSCGAQPPGCGCPAATPITLPDGTCGTLDDCTVRPAGVCNPKLPRFRCIRNRRCQWMPSKRQCVVRSG